MHACRLARAATMRDRILKFEGAYHGLHDAVLISVKPKLDEYGEERTPIAVPAGLGVAKGSVDSVVVAGFNDLPSVERRFEEHPNEIAAIIIEPIMMNVGMCLPAPGFLQGLRDIASKYGALLIFDEVKTGGKLDWGGASAYFGVKPDVITLAKSIGGGLPLAVFGARKGVMELISRHEMFHGGTFNANCVSVFAGLATFREVLTRANYAAVTRLSTKLSEGYKEIISSVGLEAYVATAGANGALMLFPRKVRNYRDWMRIDSDLWRHYWFGMANRGIIAQPYWWDEQWTISVQHTDADIRSHLEAFRDLAPDLARAQAENKTEQVSASGA